MKLPHLRRLADEVGLVLASGSARRKEILTQTGIAFKTITPIVDEKIIKGLVPDMQAINLARQKLESIPDKNGSAYLTCDTIVVLKDRIFTKPTDKSDALSILKTLSGKTHSVFTGLILHDSAENRSFSGVEESKVTFSRPEEKKLLEYIDSGEPLDKAGAYGIQGMGRFLVDSLEGNIDNVIGLPMTELERVAVLFWKERG